MIVVLAMLFMIFWKFTAWQNVSEGLRTSAVLNAEQIAGIVNILSTASPGISQTYIAPEGACVIAFDASSVSFTFYEKKKDNIVKQTYVMDFIKAPVGLQFDKAFGEQECKFEEIESPSKRPDQKLVCCSENKKEKITFTRCIRGIRVSKLEKACTIDAHLCDNAPKGVDNDNWITQHQADELNIGNPNQKLFILQALATKHYNADGSVYITDNGIGLMQVTPDMNSFSKQACNPIGNIDIAIQELNYLKDEKLAGYSDIDHLVLAAYRYGGAYIDRYVNKGEKWVDIKNRLLPEVVSFVENILGVPR
jgi:virulence-associated protein VapD